MRMLFILPGLLCTCILYAGQNPDVEKLQQALSNLYAPIINERLEAITALSNVSDVNVASQLKVGVPLFDIALNRDKQMDRSPRERVEALRSLSRLAQNGIDLPNMLDLITDELVLKDQDSQKRTIPLQVRSEAVQLLSELAMQSKTPLLVDKAFNALDKIWSPNIKGTSKVPEFLLESIARTLPAFGNHAKVSDMLIDGIRAAHLPTVQNASMNAVFEFINRSKTKDDKLKTELRNIFMQQGSQNIPERRIFALNALAALARNGLDFSTDTQLRLEAMKLISEGSDDSVMAASKFILYTFGARRMDIEVEKLIQAAYPNPNRPLRGLTLIQLNKVISELLNRCSALSPAEATRVSELIFEHFYRILRDSNVPNELKTTIVVAISCTPIEVDRTKIVDNMILYLKALYEAKITGSLVTELAKTVEYMTWPIPGTYSDGGEPMPNFDQMRKDFEVYKNYLKPGKHPLEMPSKERIARTN